MLPRRMALKPVLRADEPAMSGSSRAQRMEVMGPSSGAGLRMTRTALALTGFEVLPLAAYDAIDRMEAEAIALGYPEIA